VTAKTSLRSFNLNNLPVLREILLHGSVSKAAKALHVSQPALSGALKQLRYQFGDELIVRSNGTMRLTPKAEALLAPLEQALSAVQQLILPDAKNPLAQPAVFRIATTDYVMHLLGAPLVQTLLQENLKIMPHFLSAGGHSPQQLLNGEIEFIIMPKLSLVGSHVSSRDQDSLNSEVLFSEALVGIGSKDDKELLGDMTPQRYLEREHVSLDLDSERNISVEQAFLAGNSLKQNDIARFSCYTALLGIVAATRCIALVPASLAKVSSAMFGLQTFDPPLAFPPLEWTIIWHRRNDNDQQFRQIRAILGSCASHAVAEFQYHLVTI
jgi:LysR family nod box-dependent transcriptional activator